VIEQAAFDAHGTPVTEEALSDAKKASAVLLGAVGGPVREKISASRMK
jgi:Isocitrate/isopropylmalate dehydrogenase